MPASSWTTPGAPTGGSYPPGSPLHPPHRPVDRPGVPRSRSGTIDRGADHTGPLVEPSWWSYGSTDHPDHPGAPARSDDGHGFGRQHPSAPLPPMPTGAWDRLAARAGAGDDEPTVATPRLGSGRDDHSSAGDVQPADDFRWWEEQTGGLEVIGANVDEPTPRRRGLLRGRRSAPTTTDQPETEAMPAVAPVAPAAAVPEADPVHEEQALAAEPVGPLTDDEIPVAPYDPRSDRQRRRRRRRPFAVAFALLVLGGIIAGIVFGGQQLFSLLDPTSRDYTGSGSGSVDIRVNQGDTLSDIAGTLEGADVIASTGPFVSAAKDNPAATGIQPGVYSLRLQMSGQAALDALLEPASRQVSRVTVPEGFTVERVLARLAEQTGTPLEELQAAAAPGALELPAYAGGQLEGYLFPATYAFEPGTTPQQMLQEMVDTFTEVAGRLRLEERAAALGRTPAELVTVASMIQSETRLDSERADVAQVVYNRLAQGIPLGIDATLAYGLKKSGNDLTVTDLRTDGPYNTRTRQGLPPTPISSPGESSLEAALVPTTGDLLYYVLADEDGSHFFTSDYAEFQQARQRCADAGLGCGG
ncbi:endolytic transglycosylase MltG [Blastococcus saxobsidens]|uniref:endolytic transglycosylase MltG n=1 Tax=Blastococcus saxobsidens TaxID=138336 RepID=UPI000CEC929F|nr:endolytic transglycosylase MltG [Blastococcus saxobsidens]